MQEQTLPLIAALLMAVAGIAFLARERLYMTIYGPPDLGSVDPQNMQRSNKPNDALAATKELGLNVSSDIDLPAYPVSADTLRSALMKVVSYEADMQAVDHKTADDPRQFEDRFVQRTPAMRYPDTISAHIFALPDATDGTKRSGLFLYSRSQVGYSDLSTNRKRLDRLLHGIDDVLNLNQ